ncbi:hypothetical protein ALC57_01551 [Trachymyrmex cornetzi]|uniref:Uncharacterized protein n=1 Tax=Trachymyrmex cornetzi TaxID=471704 RepID=A0A151JPL0_9HYME|nr:hypothetical protein ALC57_01551 [Trachymyrmex cornetzi]
MKFHSKRVRIQPLLKIYSKQFRVYLVAISYDHFHLGTDVIALSLHYHAN